MLQRGLSFLSLPFLTAACFTAAASSLPYRRVEACAETGTGTRIVDTKKRFKSVGTLWINGGQGLCSASLITPSQILTAKHCVQRSENLEFTLDGIDSISGTAVVEQGGAGFLGDYAVLQLESEVPYGYPPFEVERARGGYRPEDQLAVVGYGCRQICYDRKSGSQLKIGLGTRTVSYIPAAKFQYIASSETGYWGCGGDSGGPVIDLKTGKIIAVVVAGSRTTMHFARPR